MPCNNIDGLEGAPEICKVNGGGLLLPLGGDAEQEWNMTLRSILYLLGLLWCFMGVAIIADVFMGAIEKVTSKKVLVFDKKLNKKRTRVVWNPTVANLTLMALGSSAPEILLNVIGIFPTFQAGELGPSTIVGSAAFNLLCISAVCVVSIPDGEVRKIKDMGVFGCTCFFSIFAYIWLIIILALPPSKNVVTVYEGVITFLMFWVLVVCAFLFDTGKVPGFGKPPPPLQVQKDSTPEEMARMELSIRKKYGLAKNLTPEQVALLMDYDYFKPSTRATHRVNATRGLTGGKKVLGPESRYDVGARLAKELLAAAETLSTVTTVVDKPTVAFKALNYTVLESVGTAEITVQCLGDPKGPMKVKYATRDGTALRDSDYEFKDGVLELGPGKLSATIKIAIVESKGENEDTEEFYIDLTEVDNDGTWGLGEIRTVTVVIIDEDQPGRLQFENEQLEVMGSSEDTEISVAVHRKGGSSGKVSCKVATEDGSAVAGADYVAVEQTLEFDAGQVTAEFKVKILANCQYENTEVFRVVLSEPQGGVTFDQTTDGGPDSCIQTIIIVANKDNKGRVDNIRSLVAVNWDTVSIGNANYKDQFVAALYCGGSAEDQKEAKPAEWIMHIISLPWKLLFATVPPVEYAGGWVCFCCALLMIGFVTVIIGDMAELLGCCLGISASTTAITLVALGTSLPDTFASRTAAQMDPTADNSIGNITGSNSVNVFLGLGLPWMIQAIYWEFGASCEPGDKWYQKYAKHGDVFQDFPTGAFIVPAGSLTISVATFCGCAVTCVLILMLRRKFVGGELGGPKPAAYASGFVMVCLWLVYIVVSILTE